MFKNWRFWVVGALLLGPPGVFIALGWLWAAEHGLAWPLFLVWMLSGLVFAVLSVRWTRTGPAILVPLDWTAPRTFAPRDREAWALVQAEAEAAERVAPAELATASLYLNTGLRLADRIARHYYPNTEEALDHVPLAQLLTALELAAEDLNRMLRTVPGGDMIKLAHYKTAVQAASFVTKAGEYYNYLLPFVQPVQGILRLGAHKLMAQPAWRMMQQNLMQWFFRAYVQRLGVHLIELYSGRLIIGADLYRRLTRRTPPPGTDTRKSDEVLRNLAVGVVGALGSGKSTLIAALEQARSDDPDRLRTALERAGVDADLAAWLPTAELHEIEGYPQPRARESSRDRRARAAAVAAAAECDLLLVVADAARDDYTADARFLQEWLDHIESQQGRVEPPPLIMVLTGIDRPELPGSGESFIASRVEAVRHALPTNLMVDVIPVGLGQDPPKGVADRLLPALARLLPRAERTALQRYLHAEATRSKVGRFMNQVGQKGRQIWGSMAGNVMKRVRGRGQSTPRP